MLSRWRAVVMWLALSLGFTPSMVRGQTPVPPVPPVPPQSRQQAAEAPDDNVCLGFAFGAWKPPLDWRGAGHGTRPDERSLPHAPSGRDWAASDSASGTGAMMLFPSWWPAGVVVRLPGRAPAPGDTLRGTATALVADGRTEPSTAAVIAWRVPCRRPPPPTGRDSLSPPRSHGRGFARARARGPERLAGTSRHSSCLSLHVQRRARLAHAGA